MVVVILLLGNLPAGVIFGTEEKSDVMKIDKRVMSRFSWTINFPLFNLSYLCLAFPAV